MEVFGKRQRVDVLAAAAGTIPYELTCAVSRRVPRVYYKDGREVGKRGRPAQRGRAARAKRQRK